MRQHLKLASQINRHHCYLWRLGWKLDNLPNRNYCEALLNPGNLFLFFPSESPPNLLMWNHAGLDWHRTKKFCCCHLKLEFEKRNKKPELKACCLTSLFTEMPFQHWSRLTLQTLFRSIKSYYKQPLTQAEAVRLLKLKWNEHQYVESKE